DEAAEAARIDPMDAPLFVRWAAEQGIVVATTNYGAFRYIDPKGGMTPFIFDYVIHDEAGQATAPSSLAAVLRGRRLVLAGDPKQLPPTVVSMDAKEAGLDVTLFERIEELTGHDRTRMLDVQFRMREPIVAFSNKRYYEGKLKTDPAAAAQEGLPGMPAAAFQHVTGRENERQRNGSISNDYEVEAIASLVERFRPECRDKGWTMAVLSPYQAQREAIRRKLPDVEVSTVDGAQGREWDVVLYSTVRSNPQHRLGFVEDERRLNVAVTRARRNFILVGDERTLRDNAAFNELLSTTEKVRFHYPDPVPTQHVERWERRGRRGGRDGGRDRRDGGRDRRDNRDNRGPRRDEGQRQPQGRETHDAPRDAPRTEQREPRPPQHPQQPAPPPREPHAPSPFIHNGRRRRGGPPGDPQTIPLVDPFQAPRPERRTFIVGAQEQPQPAEQPAAPAREAPARRSRKAKPAPAAEPPAPVQSRLPLPEPEPAPKPAPRKGAKKPAAKAAQAAELPAAKPAAPRKGAKKATAPPAPEPDGRCDATTQSGEPCKNKAKPGSRFCARHG
ncbi:MAG TPA: DEAD/DEAH box helicase family protein, partial [Candidatus Thermoplasmatota archaeon]|nr:DEAD/DEAH box helicase family protein [Candidatus Thermoplasmatota archaeon]